MNNEQFERWRRSYSRPDAIHPRPLIMGVLNVTPDSFSDGGFYFDTGRAVDHALEMVAKGADIIDIGGESSKPGALPVAPEEELSRVIPVIQALMAEKEICISIDTTKPLVMQEAVAVGAAMINDISALATEDALYHAAQLNVPVCLMHMQGEPGTMQDAPCYVNDVVDEINDFFQQKIAACLAAGIKSENLILDPGFGFGKTVAHNLRLVKQFDKFHQHQLPLMIGASRKSTIGKILNKPTEQRLSGGLAIGLYTALKGVAIIRTHDVEETHQVLTILQAINNALF
ncbi:MULTISPECIES: dihydropteroate synthase [unclassified Legionella]|uniref:dihydropteroate synthase n=1 Tax=unclassified Legionella TaxID=2622702 RepID=UPI001054DC3F|nr:MULTISPECIES: dihydropteroate synthase [unclassified Legionella]MDI9818944.1 dihydropteroate synthase [Legionella sp. PL877]